MPTREGSAPFSVWATVSEVSNALGIKHNTVRQVVHRALLDRQDWVKREPYPTPNGPVRWLIDTSHGTYQYYERLWQKLAEKTSTERDYETQESAVYKEICDSEQFYDLSDSEQQDFDTIDRWLELYDWLAEHELVVFVNAIAPYQGWQWSWLGRSSSGYPDSASATTAAIQYLVEKCISYSIPRSPLSTVTEKPAEPESFMK